MTNQFKVGCNFDFELINKVADLNEKYKGKAEVKEFFASPSSAAPMTARPDWRLPNISDKDFEKYVQLSLDKGISFNVVLNSIQPFMSKQNMVNHKEYIQNYVEVYLKVSLDTLRKRDKKGLYSGNTKEKQKDVTGITFNFEEPQTPDLIINNEGDISPEVQAMKIWNYASRKIVDN